MKRPVKPSRGNHAWPYEPVAEQMTDPKSLFCVILPVSLQQFVVAFSDRQTGAFLPPGCIQTVSVIFADV